MVRSQDNKENLSNLEFSKLEFNRWYHGVFSAYTIITYHNVADLFTLILKTNHYYILLIIPVLLVWIFFIYSLIVAMFNYYFVRVLRDSIKKLENYEKFKKVFEYFSNEKGICDYWKVDEFIDDFFQNPKAIDFSKYEDQKRKSLILQRKEKNIYKEKFCEIIRQYTTLS